jgi:hypothetical protein
MLEDIKDMEPYWIVEFTVDGTNVSRTFDNYDRAVTYFFERHHIDPEGLTSLIKRYREKTVR